MQDFFNPENPTFQQSYIKARETDPFVTTILT